MEPVSAIRNQLSSVSHQRDRPREPGQTRTFTQGVQMESKLYPLLQAEAP